MKKTFNFSIIVLIFSAFIFLFNSCVDQDFDEPPRDGEIADITPNSTIAQVKGLHNGFGITQITDDVVIEGVVTADDASGNYYKELVMEDASGGIKLILEFTDFNNEYPIGRKLFVKCQGLYIDEFPSDFDNETLPGTYEIGGSIYQDDNGNDRLGGIEENLADQFILKGAKDQFVTPMSGTINSFSFDDVNRLITLEGVEFIDGETGVSFADNINLQSVNRNIKDCPGNIMLLRTSGYSDFAGDLTPEGNGNITGILGAFGGSLQLFIRDLNDVSEMTGERCNGTVVNPPTGDCIVEEDFTGGVQYDPINEIGWSNVAVVGTEQWVYDEFSGDSFARMQSYQASSAANEAWLISPSLDLTTQMVFSFESELAFYEHDGLSIWFSSDYAGDVENANWSQLSANLPGSSNSNYERVNSGDINLPVGGNGVVAFKYEGTSSANTTTFRVDNIFVCEP